MKLERVALAALFIFSFAKSLIWQRPNRPHGAGASLPAPRFGRDGFLLSVSPWPVMAAAPIDPRKAVAAKEIALPLNQIRGAARLCHAVKPCQRGRHHRHWMPGGDGGAHHLSLIPI